MPLDVTILEQLAWPVTVMAAWLAGELGHRWTGLPRISLYGLVGFLLASPQVGVLPARHSDVMLLLADIAFGLILFELGYRINLRWLRCNPWIAVMGLVESLITFIAVAALALWWGQPATTALLLAALAMSTSPAAVLRVVNEQRCTGQVTERVMHLSALNCVLSVLVFKVIVGWVVLETSGNVWQALSSSVLVLVLSAGLGALAGLAMPWVLRASDRSRPDATVVFAIMVVLLVAVVHALRLSPVLATLTFGLLARHRRLVLSQAQRNFGPLGDLLAIVLFVFIAATLEWSKVAAGLGLGLALVLVRACTKTLGVAAFSRVSGVSWRKGLLSGLAMTPISVFVILVLEQTRFLGVDLVDQLAPLGAATLLLDIFGPVLTQRALVWAGEAHPEEGR
ncbi:transporter (CPA2 family) [Sphaerotilus hippei]|uniref:Transporter (CPA2 family) n=1 Tax=Sphaerotilus hippei TaxID=744406 RepID=A0A318HB94_9BURK|nr:cation:proton antiporter [Sphaerotilus hippei]PXW97979.1 transporter (CPA2 family) [Sphaerotilus hippei]